MNNEALVTFETLAHSGSCSVRFPDKQDSVSPSYLTLEGVFYHANRIPDSLFLRLPTLEDDTKLVDVTFARAAAIVETLIDTIPKELEAVGIQLRRGTVLSILALPYAQGFFFWLALIRLGCSVQWFNHELGREAMDTLLGNGQQGAGSKALLFCGLNSVEMETLGISTLYHRTGVMAINLGIEMYPANLVKTVPEKKPRLPVSGELKAKWMIYST